jgi:hypothetical protein
LVDGEKNAGSSTLLATTCKSGVASAAVHIACLVRLRSSNIKGSGSRHDIAGPMKGTNASRKIKTPHRNASSTPHTCWLRINQLPKPISRAHVALLLT